MYYKGNPAYWHHRKNHGKDFNCRDFISMFKAEKFEVLTLLLFFHQSTHKNIDSYMIKADIHLLYLFLDYYKTKLIHHICFVHLLPIFYMNLQGKQYYQNDLLNKNHFLQK